MVCLAANRVWWTAEVENVFAKAEQVKWDSVFTLGFTFLFLTRDTVSKNI
jgi:hypothetical protein